MLIKPNEHQLKRIANTIQNELLRNWETSEIANGIQRIRATDIGIISDVYVSPGLYARLCHVKYGNRSRKPFRVNNGFRVLMWRTQLR